MIPSAERKKSTLSPNILELVPKLLDDSFGHGPGTQTHTHMQAPNEVTQWTIPSWVGLGKKKGTRMNSPVRRPCANVCPLHQSCVYDDRMTDFCLMIWHFFSRHHQQLRCGQLAGPFEEVHGGFGAARTGRFPVAAVEPLYRQL